MQEILELANKGCDPDHVLEQEDVLQIFAQLHAAEVLRGGPPMGVQDLLERYNKSQRFRKRRALSNPLALRIPLLDPNRLRERLAPWRACCFPGRWPGSGW